MVLRAATPMVYELEDDVRPTRSCYLADQEAARKALQAIAAQSKKRKAQGHDSEN